MLKSRNVLLKTETVLKKTSAKISRGLNFVETGIRPILRKQIIADLSTTTTKKSANINLPKIDLLKVEPHS